jgi:hypothetical protein
MNIVPIQVTEEGILIPKTYLDMSGELELIITDNFVLLRPKHDVPSDVVSETESPPYHYSFIGIGHTSDPTASVNAEEILEREIKRESGWSIE